MFKKVRVTVGSLLASVVIAAGAVGVAAATIVYPTEGGTWDYGVNLLTTYSNYVNTTPKHASTASGRETIRSNCAGENSWAYASAGRALWGNKAYYRNTCP